MSNLLSKSIGKNAAGLALFAFFTAGIIGITQGFTKNAIAKNELAFQTKILQEVAPGNYSTPLVETKRNLTQLNQLQQIDLLSLKDNNAWYQAINQSQVSAVILPLIAPQGYSGNIELLVAINKKGELLGVRVTNHKETPGLGDKIEREKSDWILSFDGKSLSNPAQALWKVEKDGGDFDQLTGATITPRAIVDAVQKSLMFFELNKAELLKPAPQAVSNKESN